LKLERCRADNDYICGSYETTSIDVFLIASLSTRLNGACSAVQDYGLLFSLFQIRPVVSLFLSFLALSLPCMVLFRFLLFFNKLFRELYYKATVIAAFADSLRRGY